jgi:co-chaperonin GroES (HSP10)
MEINRKIRITPHEDRVLVQPDEAPKMTDSGLYIPDTAQERIKPSRGTVIAVGPGRLGSDEILIKIHNLLAEDVGKEPIRQQKIPLNVGDRILYGNYAGTPQEDPDDPKKILLIMRYADVFATLEPGEESATNAVREQ